MKYPWLARSAAVLFALTIAGCGGGGGGGSVDTGGTTPPPSGTLAAAISSAAAQPANDTSANSSASFTVLQAAGLPAVTVASPPKVNFAVFSDGKVNSSITLGSVSFAIAKLVPGANGNPDQWVNYVYRVRPAATASSTGVYTPAVKATLTTPKLATATQAFTDPKQTDPALAAAQLVYHDEGYYTYTFKTDIKNTAQTNGVVFEPGRTHRVVIQLAYLNAAGEPVYVNPYFDFTVDASGNSVPVTDASQTRKMTDVASCNVCHEKLAHHGRGRVDTQYCVMCHNPSSVDPNSGNNLNLATMVHKIHAAKLLSEGGEPYTIRTDDLSDIGFPQDLGNCTVCHSGANPSTPQGDNWKTKPSREACLTCHSTQAGSDWRTVHTVLNNNQDPLATATLMPNSACAGCHTPGSAIAPERVHFNQVQANAAKYKVNIESTAYDATARVVNVKYSLADPTNGNAAYNLVTSDCTGSGATLACASTTKFGNLRLYLAYQNMVGQPAGTTEWSASNNNGGTANAYMYKGTNDGSNHYTVAIPLPADVAGVSVAFGTARVFSIGQIKEPQLELQAATDPRPAATPFTLINVGVQHTYSDVALTGTLQPRRAVVSSEKCNACHGLLGTTSGSNTLANAFHGGARNTVEACANCHDANKMSSTVMTNGLALNESYQFKRMIHGIHGNAKRTYPFTHSNPVQGTFSKDGTLTTGGTFFADQKVTIGTTSTTVIGAGTAVPAGATFQTIADMITTAARAKGYTGTAVNPAENYAAEVVYPQASLNCNSCHVDNSYKTDRGTLGAVVFKPTGVTDPMQWMVISPKAASCTSCHDSPFAMGHVTSFGGATFGNRTQAQSLQTQEICADCHAAGLFKGVDIVHGQK